MHSFDDLARSGKSFLLSHSKTKTSTTDAINRGHELALVSHAFTFLPLMHMHMYMYMQ